MWYHEFKYCQIFFFAPTRWIIFRFAATVVAQSQETSEKNCHAQHFRIVRLLLRLPQYLYSRDLPCTGVHTYMR